jgi:hypothetical protein
MSEPHLCETVDQRPIPPFRAWERNIHSQSGEDGIIAHLLRALGLSTGYFVEFGAWDGRHLSNCAALADEGWAGCFIEGEAARHADLARGYAARPDIACIQAYVRSSGEHGLDALLQRAGAPDEITVLSIDIDGTDYHVWAGFNSRKPAVVVVEYNPTIPAEVVFAQADDAFVHQGSSLAALHRLGVAKGYVLAAATELNGVFVRADLAAEASVRAYLPHEVQPRSYQTSLFHGFDGAMLVAGHRTLVWHGVPFGADDLQVLPEELRRFPIGQPAAYFEALRPWLERPLPKK